MIEDIFPTPLYEVNLNCNIPEIQKYCLDMMSKDEGNKISNIGGWQSKNLNGLHMPLNELFEDIEYHANIFAKKIHLKKSIYLSNIWININSYKDYNVIHSHTQTFFSGVFYVKCPENCGHIEFHHPTENTHQYDWHGSKFNKLNRYNYGVVNGQSIENKMYIFPSWLLHNVTPNLNKTEKRISIAFNINEN